MHCLLCKQKIPTLRAWRTKSEFCSDEHAAQYKKQTLDRLLTEESDENSGSVPLPLDAPSFDDMDAVADIVGPDGASAGSEMDIFGDLGDLADIQESGESDDLSALFGDNDSAPASEEPAFPMRNDSDLTGYDGPPADQIETQSAEAALAALRAIAEQGAGPSPEDQSLSAPESTETLGVAADPGSLEDFLAARASTQTEEPVSDDPPHEELIAHEPVLGQEEQELAAATLAPPEPSFDDEQALLAELGFPATPPDDAQPSVAAAAADESAILDRLVEESDWNAELQSELDSEVDAEIATQLEQALADTEQPAAEALEAPTDDDFEEAVMAAVEPPDEDAVPTDDDFVESMLAAVERVSEDAGETPADVVAFPAAEAQNGVASELTRDEIDSSLEDAAVQVEASTEEPSPKPDPPAAAAPSPKLNGARPGRKKRSGRKAPKLKPAMVLAGIQPHALLDGEDASLEAWKRLAAGASSADLAGPLVADMQAGSPMLNGNGLRPIRPHAEPSALVGMREMLPTALLADGSVGFQAPTGLQADVFAPAQPFTGWLNVEQSVDVGNTVPQFEGRYRFHAANLAPTEARGEEEIPSTRRSEPLEPAGLFLDVAVDESPEAATEDDGDWFADIEGFESL